YAINILPKLVLHKENEMEEFELNAYEEEHVSEIMSTRNNTIWLGKVKKIEIYNYAINVLPKLVLHKENEMERFELSAVWNDLVSEILSTRNNTIWLGKVKRLDLKDYAINILPKLVLHKENEIEEFRLCADYEKYVSEIISAERNSIDIGKVEKVVLEDYAVNVLPKLLLQETLEKGELWVREREGLF
ncbi:MAG: uncharacterized protein A8A55_3510, partial [Amphiamblys sp. WSBS2006]